MRTFIIMKEIHTHQPSHPTVSEETPYKRQKTIKSDKETHPMHTHTRMTATYSMTIHEEENTITQLLTVPVTLASLITIQTKDVIKTPFNEYSETPQIRTPLTGWRYLHTHMCNTVLHVLLYHGSLILQRCRHGYIEYTQVNIQEIWYIHR